MLFDNGDTIVMMDGGNYNVYKKDELINGVRFGNSFGKPVKSSKNTIIMDAIMMMDISINDKDNYIDNKIGVWNTIESFIN